MTKIGERLHGVEDEKDAHAHTHTEVARDNGGGLAERVGTRCEQLGVLPRERGEGVCPLEAGHDQAGPVVPRKVEGMSAADGCARSLGGVKTPGALMVARIPRVSVPVCVVASVVPVCVVLWCVFTSVFECVLRRTHFNTLVNTHRDTTHTRTTLATTHTGTLTLGTTLMLASTRAPRAFTPPKLRAHPSAALTSSTSRGTTEFPWS